MNKIKLSRFFLLFVMALVATSACADKSDEAEVKLEPDSINAEINSSVKREISTDDSHNKVTSQNTDNRKRQPRTSGIDRQVCDYIQSTYHKKEIRNIFIRQKYIRNGYFEVKLKSLGEADSKVAIEEVHQQGIKYNAYIVSNENKGRDSVLEYNRSVRIISYKEVSYVLTNITARMMGPYGQVFRIKEGEFLSICKLGDWN